MRRWLLLCSLLLCGPALAQELGICECYSEYTETTACFEGATANGFEVCFSPTDPTADRTVTIPNADGTLILSGHALTGDVLASLDADGSTVVEVYGVQPGAVGFDVLANGTNTIGTNMRVGSGAFLAPAGTGIIEATYSEEADHLSANPIDCSAGQFANAISEYGDLTCSTPPGTFNRCFAIMGPDAADNYDQLFTVLVASTVTKVQCITNAGTATLNIEERSNVGALTGDLLTADIVCDAGHQSSCSSGCDVNTIGSSGPGIDAGDWVGIDISATATSPARATLCVSGTVP